MFSRFAAIERRVSSAIDTIYAEPAEIVYMTKASGDFGGKVVDISKPAFLTKGIADFNPVAADILDAGQYDGFQPAIAGEKIHVSFDAAKLTASTLPREGDVIRLTSRLPIPALLINRPPEPDGLGRWVCICGPGAYQGMPE